MSDNNNSNKDRANLNAWREKQPPVTSGEVLYKSDRVKIVGKERPSPAKYPLAEINAGALLARIKEEAAEQEERYISTRQKKEIKAALKIISAQLTGIHKQLNRVVVINKHPWYSKILFWRKS